MNKLIVFFVLAVVAACLAVPTPGEQPGAADRAKRDVIVSKFSSPIYRSYLPYGYRSYLDGTYYEAGGAYVYPSSPYYVI